MERGALALNDDTGRELWVRATRYREALARAEAFSADEANHRAMPDAMGNICIVVPAEPLKTLRALNSPASPTPTATPGDGPPPAPDPYCSLAASKILGFGTNRDTHHCAKAHRDKPLPAPPAPTCEPWCGDWRRDYEDGMGYLRNAPAGWRLFCTVECAAGRRPLNKGSRP